MAHTVGITGLVTVPDTATGAIDQTGFDLYKLLGATTGGGRPYSASLQISNPEYDITAFAGSLSSMGYIGGINSWTGTINMRFPNPTVGSGRCGNVTFANGYALRVNQWSAALAAQLFETTEFDTTCPSWATFVPGLISGTGSYAGGIDDATAITLPAPNGAATFRLTDESSVDNTLAGNIFITGAGPNIVVNQLNNVSHNFRFNGAITAAGDTPLFPSGAIGKPDITEIVVSADGNRDYTGFCFWTSVSITVPVQGLIDISVGIQGTGELAAG
jgi:hypothetical protein